MRGRKFHPSTLVISATTSVVTRISYATTSVVIRISFSLLLWYVSVSGEISDLEPFQIYHYLYKLPACIIYSFIKEKKISK